MHLIETQAVLCGLAGSNPALLTVGNSRLFLFREGTRSYLLESGSFDASESGRF